MMKRFLFTLVCFLPSMLFAAESVYCPQKGGYIKPGMTMDEVVSACGEPLSKQESDEPVYKKVPVKQLMYFFQNTPDTQDFQFNIRVNTTFDFDRGGTGVGLQVDVVNEKVVSIILNGSNKNAISICNDVSIQPGDDASKVYFACGAPSAVNTTFMRKAVPSNDRPKVWVYQPTPYAPSVSLTFVDGILQSIN